MESIVSYPERGKGGKNGYRGNCSPKLISDVIQYWGCREIADYMCGSGTTKDVAAQQHIESHCYDLHSGFDLLNCDIPERPEAIFFHPPYWTIVPYADSQYKAADVIKKYGYDPRSSDLSRPQPWESFIKELNYCILKQFDALKKGGRFGILVGDIKKNGKLYSMILEIVKPGLIEQIVIKAQHNVWSDSVSYSGKFIPLRHEYLLLLKKENAMIFNIQHTENRCADIRDEEIPTWRHIIASVLEEMGGKASLDELYQAIDGHKRAQTNKEWKAKIRQTLQINKQFKRESRGVWSFAA